MKVKEESEGAGLNLNIKKILRSWYLVLLLMANRGEKVEVVADFLFLGSKITAMVTAAMKSEDDCFLAGRL